MILYNNNNQQQKQIKVKMSRVINPFTDWAKKTVHKQIHNCIEKQYLKNTIIDDTGSLLILDDYDKIRINKIMKKIIKEKTYEDEKKQFAIRSACNEIMNK